MRAHRSPAAKRPRLQAQTAALEQRILERRLSIRRHTASFGRAWRNRMTSPSVLMTASSLGFLLGALTSHEPSGATPRNRKLIGGVLKFVMLARLIPHQPD
jgi:hypothetical protein